MAGPEERVEGVVLVVVVGGVDGVVVAAACRFGAIAEVLLLLDSGWRSCFRWK